MKVKRVFFNRKKQSVIFHVGKSLKAFRQEHNCWAYYVAADNRLKYSGVIGSVFLPSSRGMTQAAYAELVTHEVQHLIIDWILTRARGLEYIRRHEERIASMTGEIVRKFFEKVV